ncbi:site-specific integrase [Bacteroides sp. 519]|uniref:site-specific integrase n=1 Tax=Bacteroides sp. 519 TaxID=2302937 RepID=UPI0013D16DB6|nr:site-specific integrase [Bacteroides sp. 519]
MHLSHFVNHLVADYHCCGRYQTAEGYLSAYRSMIAFHGGDLRLCDCFTASWLHAYHANLLKRGLRSNSIVFYISRINSLYNKAVSSGDVTARAGLFDHLCTKPVPTQKRAVSPEVINQLCEGDLSKYPALAFSRDMFVLSFYLQGIAYIDLAHLRKNDVDGENLTYQRRKTRSTVPVVIDAEARKIINKYKNADPESPYLLPIIRSGSPKEERQLYKNALRKQNRHLKKIAQQLNITENLTTYVARHSWATIAHNEGVPTPVISQAMGHQSEEITHVYLQSFDHSVLSKANRIVIQTVLGVHQKQTWKERKQKRKAKWQHVEPNG